MKTGLFFDTRAKAGPQDGAETHYPVKVSISVRSSTAYIGTGIRLTESQWAAGKVKPAIGIKLSERKLAVDKAIEELRLEGMLHGLTATEIKDLVIKRIKKAEEGADGSEMKVLSCFEKFIAGKQREGTAGVYQSTVRRLLDYGGFKQNFTFQNIDIEWLEGFEKFLAKTAPSANARGIHLRNIRAVFNDALKKGYTKARYPFDSFKIKTAPTKDRSMTVEELREFFAAPCSPSQQQYRDIFLLGFLCCGINLEDLLAQKELRGGRIETERIKTGQPISIKVEPEALDIIDKYKGKTHLLDVYDRCRSYDSYLHRLNNALKTIGMAYNPHTKQWEGEPLHPDISYYWCRHSWGTIAAELDIPERTIGAALGHSTSKSVTSIYIRVDMRKKVDAANRRVIDAVFQTSL